MAPVLCMGDMPLANALRSPADVDEERRYPLHLQLCTRCATVQVAESVDPDLLFGHTYAYHSSVNRPYVAQCHAVVDRLVDRMGLGPGDVVLEVGSNDGYLLDRYVERGMRAVGVDPAKNLAELAAAKGIEAWQGFFGADVPEALDIDGRVRVVHANNVLAHVPDFHDVLAGVAAALATDGVAVVETPYVAHLMVSTQYDTVYSEHLYYWSALAFTRAVRAAGLAVVDVERLPSHCGSLRLWVMHQGAGQPTERLAELLTTERQRGMDALPFYETFASRVEILRGRLRKVLGELAAGGVVDAYGAAAKGTVLLNALGLVPGTVRRVYDNTSYKQGLLMPGVGVPIVAPEELAVDPPAVVLLLAWNFADAIMAQHPEYLANGGAWLIPNPYPRLVTANGEQAL
jgi:SAM-dependent methyltransferase